MSVMNQEVVEVTEEGIEDQTHCTKPSEGNILMLIQWKLSQGSSCLAKSIRKILQKLLYESIRN